MVLPIVQQGMNERFAGASRGTAFGDVSVFCTPTWFRSCDCVCVHRHLYHSGKDVTVVWVQGRMRFDVVWVQGSYFADDAGKIDQYVVEDQRYNAASALHQVIHHLFLPSIATTPLTHQIPLSSRSLPSVTVSFRAVQRLYSDSSRHAGSIFYAFVFRYLLRAYHLPGT